MNTEGNEEVVEQKKYKAIVIGGSAGSFPVISDILASLEKDKVNIPIIMGLHRLKNIRHGFVEALDIKSNIPIVEPRDKEAIESGKAYLAPANYHLMVEVGYSFSLSTGPMVKYSRPSIDILLKSAALTYGDSLVGILVSGANTDGADGMKAIKECSGYTIVQDPKEATITTMPDSAINTTQIDQVLKVDEIINFIKEISK